MKLKELILLRDSGFIEKGTGCPVIITGGINCSVMSDDTPEDREKMLNEGFEYNKKNLLPTIPNGFYLGFSHYRSLSGIEQYYTLVRYEKRENVPLIKNDGNKLNGPMGDTC